MPQLPPHPDATAFFEACAAGDIAALGALLDREPALSDARDAEGFTGLHRAVRHAAAVRVLLERGADPGARDEGDHALPLHGAAAGGMLDSVRALLDAGSDPQGEGDAHALDVIGWAACFDEPQRDVIDLLVEHGARHHVFSAIALNDPVLLRQVVRQDPAAIHRRLAPTEQEQTALHYVVAPPDGLLGGTFRRGDHYNLIDELIALGADPDARDARGRTPLDLAMLRGDRAAMRRLHAAGATATADADGGEASSMVPDIAAAVNALAPMLAVPDIDATVDWYRSIGFELSASHGDEGDEGSLDFAAVRLGAAEILFTPANEPWRESTGGLCLWLRTSRLDDLYTHLKQLQLRRAHALLAGGDDVPDVPFTADLYTAFYGQREFGIRDPNGVELMFYQPLND